MIRRASWAGTRPKERQSNNQRGSLRQRDSTPKKQNRTFKRSQKLRSTSSASTTVPTSSSHATKSTFEPDGVKTEGVIPDTSKQYSFGLEYLFVKSRFRRLPKLVNGRCTAVSAHLSKTAAKSRDVAQQMLGKLWKVAENNKADIITGDFDIPGCVVRLKTRTRLRTAKRRSVAKTLLGQFREVAELNNVDMIGGDFNMLANRERGS